MADHRPGLVRDILATSLNLFSFFLEVVAATDCRVARSGAWRMASIAWRIYNFDAGEVCAAWSGGIPTEMTSLETIPIGATYRC